MTSGIRVIGYVRCSSAEQAAEGLSIEAQRDRIEAWCAATGAELTELVVDAGVSGTVPLARREGGAKIAALLDARRPTVDAIVVVRLDRLGRDAGETLTLVRRFTNGPLGLVSVSDRLDLSTAHGRAMAGVAAVFAELERALIAERTSEALASLRRQGRIYGPVPYGFDGFEDRLVPNDREQTVIGAMARMRAKGTSYNRIAEGLNAKGIPAKRGGRWYAMSVRNVLRTSTTLEALTRRAEAVSEAA